MKTELPKEIERAIDVLGGAILCGTPDDVSKRHEALRAAITDALVAREARDRELIQTAVEALDAADDVCRALSGNTSPTMTRVIRQLRARLSEPAAPDPRDERIRELERARRSPRSPSPRRTDALREALFDATDEKFLAIEHATDLARAFVNDTNAMCSDEAEASE